MSTLDNNWSCRLDSIQRKRYYLNGKPVSVRVVPKDIRKTLEPVKKTVPVESENGSNFYSNSGTNSYFNRLPLDLIKLFLLYVSPDNLKKLIDVQVFKPLCENDEFWHKLFLTHFSSNPKVNIKTKSWTGWRDYYIKSVKNSDTLRSKPKETRLARIMSNGWEKKIRNELESIDDSTLLYYALTEHRRKETASLDMDLIKYVIEERKLNWPEMYRGRNSNDPGWLNFRKKFKLYMTDTATPLSGRYSIELNEYLMKFIPESFAYLPEIIHNLFNDAFYSNNVVLMEHLILKYPSIGFPLDNCLQGVQWKREIHALPLLKLLTTHGVNLKAQPDLVVFASRRNSLGIVKYLDEQGVDIHLRQDQALVDASRYGHLDIVKYLVSKGANIHAQDDAAVKGALISMGHRKMGNKGVIKYLLKNGASVDNLTEVQQATLNRVLQEK